MKPPKALGVLRRFYQEARIYHAWLYHEPSIHSFGIGVGLTKDFLQIAANQADNFPTRDISNQDIASALASEGDEVMLFFVIKGAKVELGRYATAHKTPDIPTVTFSESYPLATAESPGVVLPERRRPRIPPPPMLDPYFNFTGDKIEMLSILDREHQKMMVTALMAGVDEFIVAPERHTQAAADFSRSCFDTAQILSGFDITNRKG
jgi:hypothetical protein